jgi:hypothetical protein
MRAALWHLGGLGDVYDAAHLGIAIREADAPSFFAIYVRNQVQADLVRTMCHNGSPVFDYVIISDLGWDEGVGQQSHRWDVFYEWKPYVAVRWTPVGDDRSRPDKRSMPREMKSAYKHMLSKHTNRLRNLGLSVHEVGCASLGIEPVPCDWLSVVIPGRRDAAIRVAADRQYLTVNNGSDAGLRKNVRQTKEWTVEQWAEVIARVRGDFPRLKVIHVGATGEPHIPGAFSLVGETSVLDMLYLLERSLLHLGPENGAVRLARATGTDSVVVYGPTDPTLYALSGNSGLRTDVCEPCFWKSGDWMFRCTNSWGRMCMQMLSVDDVYDAVAARIDEAMAGESNHQQDGEV